jgi:hypothetical protein
VDEYSVFDSEEEEDGSDAGVAETNEDLTDEERDIQEVVYNIFFLIILSPISIHSIGMTKVCRIKSMN